MDRTANLDLPYILPSQAQKHVTHNEALRGLDAVVHLGIVDRDLTDPPSEPVEGANYIPAPGAAGEWLGKEGRIAAFQDGAWAFYEPKEGWIAWIADEAVLVVWNGSEWADANPAAGNFETLSVNGGAASSYNRFASRGPATLLDNSGNGHQLVINKKSSGDTASIVFQTNYSGRAEFGLTGTDGFRIKLSEDGSLWQEVFAAEASNGNVFIGTPPQRLTIDPAGRAAFSGPVKLATVLIAALPDATEAGQGALIFVTDDTGGPVAAFSDGAIWRRMTDRAPVSPA